MSIKKIMVILVVAAIGAVGQNSVSSASVVDSVISLVKSGMSESLILDSLRRQNKPVTLSAADLLRLQKANVSEAIIGAMMDAGGAGPAPSPAPAPSAPRPTAPAPPAARPTVLQPRDSPPPAYPAPISQPPAQSSTNRPTLFRASDARTPDPPAPSAPSATGLECPQVQGIATAFHKRRLAVLPFKFAANMNYLALYYSGNPQAMGEELRALIVARLAQSNSVVLVERSAVDQILKEQDFGATSRVNQGTKAKTGQVTGADAILLGDIVKVGRDDNTTTNHKSSPSLAGLPGIGAIGTRFPGVYGNNSTTVETDQKAVFGIAYRIVDVETGEVINTGESHGEASRHSSQSSANNSSSSVGASSTSSGFAQTILGEAAQDAVGQAIAWLNDQIPRIGTKSRALEGKVAAIEGCKMYLSVGATDSVRPGDHFEILQIVRQIHDPDTHEVIGTETQKMGDFVASQVESRMSIGTYGGRAISEASLKSTGYAARLVQ